jgi:hypothetical protein
MSLGFGFSLPARTGGASAFFKSGDILLADGVFYLLLENGDKIKIDYLDIPPPPPP